MYFELGFKVQIVVHQAEGAEERKWRLEKALEGGRQGSTETETIACFGIDCSDHHKEFTADRL